MTAMHGPAQAPAKDACDALRQHYERIWQKGGEGWHSGIKLAINAYERELENKQNNLESKVQSTGLLLKRARKTQGVTQAELAKRVWMSEVHIQALERGSSDPPLDTLRRLAHALGYTAYVTFKQDNDGNA